MAPVVDWDVQMCASATPDKDCLQVFLLAVHQIFFLEQAYASYLELLARLVQSTVQKELAVLHTRPCLLILCCTRGVCEFMTFSHDDSSSHQCPALPS